MAAALKLLAITYVGAVVNSCSVTSLSLLKLTRKKKKKKINRQKRKNGEFNSCVVLKCTNYMPQNNQRYAHSF